MFYILGELFIKRARVLEENTMFSFFGSWFSSVLTLLERKLGELKNKLDCSTFDSNSIRPASGQSHDNADWEMSPDDSCMENTGESDLADEDIKN